MDSENVFDIYSAPEAPEAPSSKKKTSKRHPGESSKAPPAKKTRIAGPPADGPSTNVTPPPSPLEQQTPPAPVESTPSPLAPTDQTQQAAPASTGGDISSHALRSVKDRVAKILKHEHCQEAMLTLTASRLCSGAITEQSRALEQRHAEELKAAEAKYTEQLEAMLEEKNKLAEEVKEKQTTLDKAIDQRDNFKESNHINYHENRKLEEDLTASRQETATLEGRIEKLEKANARNLEREPQPQPQCRSTILAQSGKGKAIQIERELNSSSDDEDKFIDQILNSDPDMFRQCIASAPKRKAGDGSGSTPPRKIPKTLMTFCHAQQQSVDYKELIKQQAQTNQSLTAQLEKLTLENKELARENEGLISENEELKQEKEANLTRYEEASFDCFY
ncbi:uncharacterized protein LOC133825052 [Humulus lupulus]|uniref:uncharacterized protein LOC133825052 n=1 Tax=Humulus lupulus TaxID=3486 RepID=UPI002B40E7D7|nr:uncharacterized protein LOC133825052 [Humulus lupulus]